MSIDGREVIEVKDGEDVSFAVEVGSDGRSRIIAAPSGMTRVEDLVSLLRRMATAIERKRLERP